MSKQTIDDVEVAGRRILVRVDFNVPVEEGRIVDDRRIRAVLPTVQALQTRGARIVLATHVGRPKGEVVPALTVAPMAARLEELLGTPVSVAADVVGPSARALVDSLRDGEIGMLENVRFEPGEEQNSPALAEQFAAFADLYVNDAFGTAHRAHASTEGVAHRLLAVAGYLMAEELSVLSRVLNDPAPPLVSILGGSKISTKLGVIEHLLGRVETLWIGGAMACTFYRALGEGTGQSLVEPDLISTAHDLLARGRTGTADLRLPIDVVVAPSRDAGVATNVVSWKNIPPGMMVVDVGPETVRAIADSCRNAGTIVWNGPLGIYEIDAFAHGTRSVARAVAASRAISVIGGGDLGAAIDAAGVAAQMSFISTGGGATLEFLEGRVLPGVAALADRVVAGDGAPVDPLAGPRVPLVAGNWKMHTTVEEGLRLIRALVAALPKDLTDVAAGAGAAPEVVVLPPFTHLWPMARELAGNRIGLGAQNVHWENAGAHTGEVAPTMLSGWCDYVLIGHSERRAAGETNEQVNRKLRRSLEHDLRAIVAVGETLDQYEAGATAPVVEAQLDAAFAGVAEGALSRVVVAYEPVWAIGTGRTATPEVAQLVCHAIRTRMRALYSPAAAAAMRILYGGSVTAGNAAQLFGEPDIDGGLIGGASLLVPDFAAIVRAAAPVAAGSR